MAKTTSKRFRCPSHWTLAQRLDHYTDKSGGPDACWPWTGYCNEDGYGQLFWDGRRQSINRLTWIEANGPIPDGLHVLHECDNPPCRNESHLFLGTNADNVADRERKGRNRPPSGERHPRAKLTVEKVRLILASPGKHRDIAAQFGVTHPLVGAIKRGKIWKHIPR